MKILIVDDSKTSVKLIEELIKHTFKDFVYQSAFNGKEGLECYNKTKDFDLIITDYQMPCINGNCLIKQIKQINSNVLSICISSESFIKDDVFDFVLQKPIHKEEFISILQKIKK